MPHTPPPVTTPLTRCIHGDVVNDCNVNTQYITTEYTCYIMSDGRSITMRCQTMWIPYNDTHETKVELNDYLSVLTLTRIVYTISHIM